MSQTVQVGSCHGYHVVLRPYTVQPTTNNNLIEKPKNHVRLKEAFPTPVTPFESIGGHCMHAFCNGKSHRMVKL